MLDPVKELLNRRVAEIIKKEHFESALRSGAKLRVKFGIDPTASDLHLGHTVPLLKLKEFQDLGHQIILIIGDTTATIGDPTGRFSARKILTKKEVEENMKTYKEQVSKILDPRKTEFVYNSKWFGKMNVADLMELASTATFQQIRERKEFRERLERGEEFAFAELFYPIMQGYDSVQVKADVEIGGTDQKFNLLMGRQVQKRLGQKEQDILMVPLLIGTDGKEKMSKSAVNFIAIQDKPEEMFAKIMSLPDDLVPDYFDLCTEISTDRIKELKRKMVSNPMDVKKELAFEITKIYHGEKQASEAQREFTGVFGGGEAPKDAPIWKIAGKKVNLIDLLTEKEIVKSKSEARRLLVQRGITLDDQKLSEPDQILNKGVLRIGKKTFIKIE